MEYIQSKYFWSSLNFQQRKKYENGKKRNMFYNRFSYHWPIDMGEFFLFFFFFGILSRVKYVHVIYLSIRKISQKNVWNISMHLLSLVFVFGSLFHYLSDSIESSEWNVATIVCRCSNENVWWICPWAKCKVYNKLYVNRYFSYNVVISKLLAFKM